MQGGQCVYADTYCSSKYGLYASYDSVSNSCECDDGYTLDDYGQCVEKQNNVYFRVLDVDTDNNQAIIKSEYDYSQYLIKYGYGCYSFSFNRYVGRQIVVNLGTDFDLDIWDKIVLQDDDEVCDIESKERVYYDSFEEIANEEDYYENFYIPPSPPVQNTSVQDVTVTESKTNKVPLVVQEDEPPIQQEEVVETNDMAITSTHNVVEDETLNKERKSFLIRVWEVFLSWFR
jgi:hypothetical protein